MNAFTERMREAAVVAVIRAPNPGHALAAADAVVAGGVTAVEVTFTVPDADFVIASLVRRYSNDVLIGAGTIRNRRQVDMAIAAGAEFLVSPGVNEEVAALMRDSGAGVVLGALTPGEVMQATALGAHLVKVFPASLGGPAYLRALRGPFPHVPFLPTGGVSQDNVADWMRAGATAVGAGSSLCPVDDDFADWQSVTRTARALVLASRKPRPVRGRP